MTGGMAPPNSIREPGAPKADGDLIVYSGGSWARLPSSTSGYVLTSVGADALPTWSVLPSLPSDAGLTSLAGQDGSAGLPYVSAANTWTRLALAANKGIHATGTGTLATHDSTAYGRSLVGVADEATLKALINLEPGTDVQAYDAGLLSLTNADASEGFVYCSGANAWTRLAVAGDKGIYATGPASFATYDLTSFARTLLDDANQGAARTTLGVGTGDAPTFAGLTLGSGNLLADYFVRATVAVSDSTGGATDSTLTVDLHRLDGTTQLSTVRQVLIVVSANQYEPGLTDTSPTFLTATKGSIVASGGGWCLAETNAAGEFACTARNLTDETVYFSAQTASKVSNSARGCLVVASNSDPATWSA